MSVPARLAGFALVLAVAFGAGAALGSSVGPIAVDGDGPHPADGSHDGHQ